MAKIFVTGVDREKHRVARIAQKICFTGLRELKLIFGIGPLGGSDREPPGL
jgi:hypothetical protein